MCNITQKKLKKKINITINREILKKIDDLSTNKSRLIEYIILEYLHKHNINTDNIIL
jgi:post-segregation antitoxin (ccd killing protein)